ncbi:MAG: IspD/TarI family cytidylyltransferase [Chloroflexota bacterium]
MNYAIILAAGRGTRMAATRNKALLPLAGRPLLLHSVDTLLLAGAEVLLVAAEEELAEVATLAPGCALVRGGATRRASEWRGLHALRDRLQPDDVVALHDAARPLVAGADALRVFQAARAAGAALLAQPADAALLRLAAAAPGESAWPTVVEAVAASRIWRAQTPQAARASWLLDAYERAEQHSFEGTDTAAVLDWAGYPVQVVAATGPNPKITVAADIPLAEAMLAAEGSRMAEKGTRRTSRGGEAA